MTKLFEEKKLKTESIFDKSFKEIWDNILTILSSITIPYILGQMIYSLEVNNTSITFLTEKFVLSERDIIKKVSCVPQNIHLFSDTIINNISCFGNIFEEEVYSVCQDLGIHEKIIALPNGYNTIIDEKNLNLSGGEKQMICIARALLKESDLLILDEINKQRGSRLQPPF